MFFKNQLPSATFDVPSELIGPKTNKIIDPVAPDKCIDKGDNMLVADVTFDPSYQQKNTAEDKDVKEKDKKTSSSKIKSVESC